MLQARIDKARQMLDKQVRPEFRVDVLLVNGSNGQTPRPPCGESGCAREARRPSGLCNGHWVRWDSAGRPDLARFKATTSAQFWGHHRPVTCAVKACRHGRHWKGLCYQHFQAWQAAGKPLLQPWLETVVVPDDQGTECRLSHCDLIAQSSGYCKTHTARWRRRGQPDPDVFEAEVLMVGDSRYDFKRLPGQLKLELQYALQCRHDERRRGSVSLNHIVRVLLRSKASSLLERTRAEWDDAFMRGATSERYSTNGRAFLGFAVEHVVDLVEGCGWEAEYPRDVWEIRRLPLSTRPGGAQRRLIFADITEPWLYDLAKTWVHWRLAVDEIAIDTAVADLAALRQLSRYLRGSGQAAESVAQLTRPVIEGYLAWDRAKPLGRATIRDHVSALAVFLRQLREHEHWAPALPANAIVYSSDYPKHTKLPPRGLSSYVMNQVHAHLEEWKNPESRLATRIMIGAGLRVGDCCRPPFDCLARDADGHPYLRYWNHKMHREAYVPIDADLQQRIEHQKQRVADRFPTAHAALMREPAPRAYPATGLCLLPAIQANPFGHKPFPTHVYNEHLQKWASRTGIVEESGQPAKLTSHRWRHTYATGLINRGVRLEVVKALLDHATLDMASHYARLFDTTVRTEWERAQKDAGASLDSPAALADASWANRIRTALPNGVCGLPRQQICPHSNKCLTCPVFVTTGEHLPVHQAQRDRTADLIEEFEARGPARLAEQNRQVLDQLDHHIERLQTASANRAGGASDAS